MVIASQVAAAEGDLDLTFGSGGIAVRAAERDVPREWATSVLFQPDEKILAGGTGTTPGTTFALVRLNPDSSLDGTFGSGGRLISEVVGQLHAVALLPDGRFVAAGDSWDEITQMVESRCGAVV
ncbi:MAG TPA: hypothetical protein VEB21_10615 [Terriglobales bacterium]|nr:hypothetical protein [Terriglobales bacterium]